jgi:hypothetical protein
MRDHQDRRNREPIWEPDRTADLIRPWTHGAQTAVLGVQTDPPDQPGRLVETFLISLVGTLERILYTAAASGAQPRRNSGRRGALATNQRLAGKFWALGAGAASFWLRLSS